MALFPRILIGAISFAVAYGPVSEISACVVPMIGTGMSRDEIIESAENIFLVEVDHVEVKSGDSTCYALGDDGKFSDGFPCEIPASSTYYFSIIEVIKGEAEQVPPLTSTSKTHYSNDFDLHRDEAFWNSDTGRAEWPCCICGPDYTFREGEQYLLFPDLMGAMAAAEIVNSPADKWLEYVKARVAKNMSERKKN